MRPRTRTDVFNLDDARRILDLFGTVPNAHTKLAPECPLADVRRALQGKRITPATKAALGASWARWRRYFGLRNDVIDYRWENLDNPGRKQGHNVHPRDIEIENKDGT